MPRAEAIAILEEARHAVDTRNSYAALRATDLGTAFGAAAARIGGDGISLAELTELIDSILCSIGDGHASARCEGWMPRDLPGMAAVLSVVEPREGGRVAVLAPGRSGLLDARHPYLTAIDGVPLERWVDAVRANVASGSPQLVRSRCVQRLMTPTAWRNRVGVDGANDLGCELTLTDGRTAEVSISVALKRSSRDAGPFVHRHGPTDASVGYVRIDEMDADDRFLRRLEELLERTRGARGLIIDVRANSGGSRDAIGVVARFLMTDEAGPVVFNVARPLVLPGDTRADMDARMATRSLFRAEHAGWSPRERAAIDRCRAGFTPEIAVPEQRFGEWYYAVASRRGLGGRGTNEGPPHGEPFQGRVVVLLDEGCFSATDVFLAAVKEMGASLVGSPSAGGSGLTTTTEIAGGRIRLRLSSMVSYRSDGLLFDGRGVEPHIMVERVAADGTPEVDTTLARALEILATPR